MARSSSATRRTSAPPLSSGTIEGASESAIARARPSRKLSVQGRLEPSCGTSSTGSSISVRSVATMACLRSALSFGTSVKLWPPIRLRGAAWRWKMARGLSFPLARSRVTRAAGSTGRLAKRRAVVEARPAMGRVARPDFIGVSRGCCTFPARWYTCGKRRYSLRHVAPLQSLRLAGPGGSSFSQTMHRCR
jgi:hypothetical protein